MSRVSGSIIIEYNVLLILAALNDLIGTGAELVLDLVDDGHNEWSNDGEDEDRKLLLELLNDLGEDWDLIDGL